MSHLYTFLLPLRPAYMILCLVGLLLTTMTFAQTPTISGFAATSSTVCSGNGASFTATVGNVTGSYDYTLINGSSSVNGTTSSTSFSASLVVSGSGSQSFSLTVSDNGSSTVASTSLTVGSHPDYQPLVDLYNSANGSAWTNKTGWLTNCNPCGWFGVGCSGGRVTSLNLFNHHLSGTIPASLSALSNLTSLNLSSNQLSGSIPASLSTLSNLTSLFLFSNQLSGSIPTSLSALSNLTVLQISSNQLSGTIPPSLSALSNLTDLRLNSNSLSGSIPEGLSALTNLTILSLYGNQLSGSIPTSLSALSNLIQLSLDHNQLSGTIPSSLSALSNLTALDLSSNQLSGSIPASLSTLSNLTFLFLFSNQLSGTIPASLSALSNLIQLSLSNNQLSGSIPASLSTLSNLTSLFLFSNQLSGTIPTSLSVLTNLTILDLSSNQLSGTIPASLSALSNLTSLDLSSNQLSGSIPTSLSALTNLTNLRLYSNSLSGSIPASLSALSNLTYLALNDNHLSGSIPSSLSALINLTDLRLNNNSLSGCYPASLTALCGVTIKNFSGNTGLPGGGSAAAFSAFCASGQGSDAFVATATASLSTVCLGGVISLSTAGGSSYSWSAPPGALLTTNASNSVVSASLTTSGLKTFTVVVSNGGTCSQTATVSVTGTALPGVSVGASSTSVLVGSSTSLTASGGSTAYQWSAPSGALLSNPTNTSAVSATLTAPGNKTFSVVVTQGSCSQTLSVSVAAYYQAVDLAPTMLLDNLNFNAASVGVPRDFIVSLSEVSNQPSSGTISFKIAKLTAFTITYPTSSGTSNVGGGMANTNGSWTISEDEGFITVSTSAVFGGFSNRIVGFSIARKAGIPFNTVQSINVIIVPNAGSEQNFANNIAITSVTTN